MFRAYVLDKFDTDRNGRISRAEAEAVTEIDISGTWDDFSAGKGVTSLEGISYFKNLRILKCPFNPITEIDLSQNRMLEELNCAINKFAVLDLSQQSKLKTLLAEEYPYEGEITEIILPTAVLMYPLEVLCCNNNKLTRLKLGNLVFLRKLTCSDNNITSLGLGVCANLKELDCQNNKLTRLDLSVIPALEYLYCDDNELASLDVSHCPGLVYLGCSNNKLSSLNVGLLLKLATLGCSGNNLTKLDLSKNKQLERLYCDDNDIKSLNISGCSILKKVYCESNPLQYFDFSGTALDYLKIPNRIYAGWKYAGAKEPSEVYAEINAGISQKTSNLIQQLDKVREKEKADRAEEKRSREAEAQQRETARAEAKQKAAEFKRLVMPYLTRQDWEGADKFAAEALAKLPEGDAFLYLVRAKVYFKLNLDFEVNENENMTEYFRAYRNEAEHLAGLCRKSIACDPADGSEAYFYRGMAYIVLGRADDAATDFKNCARGNEALKAVCYYNIGTAYKNAGRYNPALEQFKLARQYYTAADKKEQCLQRIKECQQKISGK